MVTWMRVAAQAHGRRSSHNPLRHMSHALRVDSTTPAAIS
uniref:Uncharacterized protein n=1 Tax=Siphoviridae sp. ct0eR1 TaxID=2825297 RepID=A0A8S5UHD5_9CAUD|nr:MAG TPA: hypothetical protein [Siphoviridae sp. ct0eR1]